MIILSLLDISSDWDSLPLESILSIMEQFWCKKLLPYIKWKANLLSLLRNGLILPSGDTANKSNSSFTAWADDQDSNPGSTTSLLCGLRHLYLSWPPFSHL